MNLVWHIALNDLRRLRVPVGFWFALIAAKIGLGLMLIFGVGFFEPLYFGSNALAVFEMVIGYLLVASVMHGDVLVGSTSFWMTRPVSNGRLFAGKLAGLAVIFAGIPLILTVPWWLICGYGGKEMLLASAETLMMQAVVVCVALPIATLTDGLGRFLFWTLIWITALILSFAMTPAIGGKAVFLLFPIFAISGTAGAVLHALKRRFFVGAGVFGAVVLTVGMTWAFWPSVQRPAPASPVESSPHAAGVNVSVLPASAQERVSTAAVSIPLRLTGVPTTLLVQGYAHHRWNWPDGTVLERQAPLDRASWLWVRVQPREKPHSIEAFRSILGLPFDSHVESTTLGSTVLAPVAFVGRTRREIPNYSLTLDLKLLSPALMGERPARTGEKITSGLETTRVITDLKSDQHFQYLQLKLPEYRPTVYSRSTGGAGFGPLFWFAWPRRAYFSFDRSRGSISPEDAGDFDSHRTKVIRVGTVGIVWRMLYVSPPRSSADGIAPPPDWFEQVSVAKFETREVERFTKEVHVERFELASSFRPGGGTR